MKKRMIALLLAVIMVIGMIPSTVLAADNAPQNVHWQTGSMAYLAGAWDPPAGSTHEECSYDVALYYSPNGVDNWTSLPYHYVVTYTPVNGVMTVDPSYIAMYGEGYYKFKVACSSLSAAGESEWAESDVYHFTGTGTKGTISAPVSGAFGMSNDLSWNDPEDIDSGFYEHRAIVEMWYIGDYGELPEEEWELVKRESVYGDSICLDELLYDSEFKSLKQGMYIFYVQNLADDFLWRGMSEPFQLEGFYYHVPAADGGETETPLPTPTGLAWTESGIYMDNPADYAQEIGDLSLLDNYGGITVQLLMSSSADTDPADAQVIETIDQLVSAEMLLSDMWDARLVEYGHKLREIAKSYGEDNSYWFRVQAVPADTTKNSVSAWAYSPLLGTENVTPDTPDTPVTPDTTKTLYVEKPYWTQEGLHMDWYADEADLPLTDYYLVEFVYCADAETLPDNAQQSMGGWSFSVDRPEAWNMPENALNGDGYYYFRVRARAKDSTQAQDGPWSEWSGPLHYEAPDLKLDITATGWNGSTPVWSVDFNENLVYYYDVMYFHGDTEAELAANIANQDHAWWTSYDPYDRPTAMPTNMLRQYGTGYYAFKVCAYTADPMQALSGDWSTMSTVCYLEGASQKMPAPTDLKWGVERYYEEEGEQKVNGVLSFAGTVPNGMVEVEYRVAVYRKEAGGDVLVETMRVWQRWGQDYVTAEPFESFPDLMTSGTYYCTVTALGDGIIYNDSDPVQSGDWTYTRPNTVLTASKPYWNTDMTVGWTTTGGTAEYYRIQFLYVPAGSSFENGRNAGTIGYYPDSSMAAMPNANVLDYGTGTYYFRVRPISGDVTQAVGGDWSEWSEGFSFTAHNNVLTATNLRWSENGEMLFDLTGGDASMVDHYLIRIYYGENEGSGGNQIRNMWYDPEDAPFTLSSNILQNYGAGYYWFDVRAYSKSPALAYDSDGYSAKVSRPYHLKGPEQQAAAPTDLQWGVERWQEGKSNAVDGMMSFKNPCYDDTTHTEFKVEVYRKGANGDEYVGSINTRSRNRYISVSPFEQFPEYMTSGTYYFTVTTVGDMINTSSSDPVKSGVWTFTHPGKQLEVSNPWWRSDMTMGWNIGEIEGDWYQIRYQYVAPGGTFYKNDWHGSTSWYPDEETAPCLDSWVFDKENGGYGEGTYYFKVRAMSENVESIMPSEWTDWSEGFEYKKPSIVLDPRNITWDETTRVINWSIEKPEYVDYYEVELLYGPAAGQLQSAEWFRFDGSKQSWSFPQWVFEDYGPGYYGFILYAYSNNPMMALPGSSICETVLVIGADLEPAPQAYDLQWNVYRNREEDRRDQAGVFSFVNPLFDNYVSSAEFKIEVYRKGENGADDEKIFSSNSGTNHPYIAINLFEQYPEKMISGTYYFTVVTKGDMKTTASSETVRSEDWTYFRPEAQLEVSDPVWGENMTMSWQIGSLPAAGYKIRMQHVGAGDSFSTGSWDGTMTCHTNTGVGIPADMLERKGAGTYYFQVAALSDNVNEIAPSDWSKWSEGYVYSGADLEPAKQATELQWNMQYNGAGQGSPREGVLAFKNPYYDGGKTDTFFYVDLYRQTEGGSEHLGQYRTLTNMPYISVDTFEHFPNQMTPGTYWFTVVTDGDGIHTSDSQPAVSGTWEYIEQPVLPVPYTPVWVEGGVMGWICDGHTAELTYEIEIQRVAAGDALNENEGFLTLNDITDNPYALPAWIPEKYGEGDYHFRVRTVLTQDDGTVLRSDWSDWSDAWTYVEEPQLPAAPTGARWMDSTTMTWSSELENVEHYELHIQYVADGEQFDPNDWHHSRAWYSIPQVKLEDSFFYSYGTGTYYFRVRACVWQDGSYVYTDYSDWSEGMEYELPAPEIEADAYGRCLYIDGFLPELDGVEYLIALYNADGRMLQTAVLDYVTEQNEIRLDSDCPAGAYVKVFPTENWCPSGNVLETDVKVS